MTSSNDNSQSLSIHKQDHTEMASPFGADTFELFNSTQEIGSVGKALNAFMPKMSKSNVEIIHEASQKYEDYDESEDEDIPLLKNVKIVKSKKEKKRFKNKKYRIRRRKILKEKRETIQAQESTFSSHLQVVGQKLLQLQIKENNTVLNKSRNKRKKRSLKEDRKKLDALNQLFDIRKANNGGVMSRTDFKHIEEIKKIDNKKESRYSQHQIAELIRKRIWDKYIVPIQNVKTEFGTEWEQQVKIMIAPRDIIEAPPSVPLDWVEMCYPGTLEELQMIKQ